ncbi:MAG: HEPN domain-containing protein [Fusobacteriaceae bacterium]
MSLFINELESFIKIIDEITVFIESIEDQKKIVICTDKEMMMKNKNFKKKYTEEVERFKKLINSKVHYNAVIISVFSGFETFIRDSLEKYLVKLKICNRKYKELPEKLKDKHIKKTAEFLSFPNRHKSLNLQTENVIKNLGSILNESEYELNNSLLIAYDGNISGKKLEDLFVELGIKDLENNLSKSKKLKESLIPLKGEHYMKGDSSKIMCILDEILNIRNEIAHSWLNTSSRISYERIKDMLRYLKELGTSLIEILDDKIKKEKIKINEYIKIEIMEKDSLPNNVVKIGDINYFLKKNSELLFYTVSNGELKNIIIKEIRSNNEPIENTLTKKDDITIKISKNKLKENQYMLFLLFNPNLNIDKDGNNIIRFTHKDEKYSII